MRNQKRKSLEHLTFIESNYLWFSKLLLVLWFHFKLGLVSDSLFKITPGRRKCNLPVIESDFTIKLLANPKIYILHFSKSLGKCFFKDCFYISPCVYYCVCHRFACLSYLWAANRNWLGSIVHLLLLFMMHCIQYSFSYSSVISPAIIHHQ